MELARRVKFLMQYLTAGLFCQLVNSKSISQM